MSNLAADEKSDRQEKAFLKEITKGSESLLEPGVKPPTSWFSSYNENEDWPLYVGPMGSGRDEDVEFYDFFGLYYPEMNLKDCLRSVSEITNPNHLQLIFELVTALRDGKSVKLDIRDEEEIDWSRVPRIPLPEKAPELYISAAKSGDIIKFLNRVYGPAGLDHPTRPNHPGWLDGVSMSRMELGKLDPKAKKRLENVEYAAKAKVNSTLLNLPSDSVIRDRRDTYEASVVRADARQRMARQRAMERN